MKKTERLKVFQFLADNKAIVQRHFQAEVWRAQSKKGYVLKCKVIEGDGDEGDYQHIISDDGDYDTPTIPAVFLDAFVKDLAKQVYLIICQNLNDLNFVLGIATPKTDS